MPRISPGQAVERYLAPFRTALGCIAHGTRITTTAKRPEVDQVFSMTINRNEPINLRRNPAVAFRGGQLFRIIRDDGREGDLHRVQTIKYFYAFQVSDGQELLSFQWTPEAVDSEERTFPHLHVGRGLTGAKAAIFPGTFHKKHIPTGHVSFASIVRFAIEELGVPPVRADWRDILDPDQPPRGHVPHQTR